MSNFRYRVSDKAVEQMNFKLLYVTSASYDTDWHSTIHSHPFTELFYVIRGKGEFLIEEESFHVHCDDLIIVNPHVEHTEVSNANDPLEYIALGMEGILFNTNEDERYSVHNYYNYKHESLFYLKTLVEEVSKKDHNYELVCNSLLELLLINMMRRTNTNLQIASSKKAKKECMFVEKYINEHFREEITLDALAEMTYTSKYYLVHAFKKYKDISPINFLIQRRIEEAKNLLETINYSISQISEIIGFSSQSYFSQIFKKVTNMSPNQYRKIAEQNKTLTANS